MGKAFKIAGSELRPVAKGLGACFATDRITVDGSQVGYMYREEPDNRNDLGWRFTAGNESEAYMDDPANLEIYDVNTIANYDPDIIPLLHAPIGSRFMRLPPGSPLRPDPG